jgi:hypothetical protein
LREGKRRKKEEVEVEATVISKKKRRHRIFGRDAPKPPFSASLFSP